ncbi:MAG: hypothetical protein R2698_08260 [Microthrixaceae bacterium]
MPRPRSRQRAGGSLTPSRFAEIARTRGREAGLKVSVLDGTKALSKGLGGLLGVGRGSAQDVRFVKMEYTPSTSKAGDAGRGTRRRAGAKGSDSIALVGKGITFDSGGLSLKPAESMMTMKCDMGGAAAVVATMCALGELGVRVPVTSYTPMTDNMPGPDATRPGDVLTYRNGTTVEVLNTDAEGRLVLADALDMASGDGHGTIVDLATLTGACMVALGDRIAGLMGNDDDLIEELRTAADNAGEKVWPLPLPTEYRTLLDSPIADLKNIGGRYGGTLTAGCSSRSSWARTSPGHISTSPAPRSPRPPARRSAAVEPDSGSAPSSPGWVDDHQAANTATRTPSAVRTALTIPASRPTRLGSPGGRIPIRAGPRQDPRAPHRPATTRRPRRRPTGRCRDRTVRRSTLDARPAGSASAARAVGD